MQLHEEYCHRHDLCYPVIKRPDDTMTLLYRTDRIKWDHPWMVLQISKKPENYHPYYYHVGLYYPVRNGTSLSGGALAPIGDIKKVEWDEYDQELVDMACRSHMEGLIPITDLSEAKLAAWEIFLLSADDNLSEYGDDLLVEIMQSIDLSCTIEDRMKAQDRVVERFQSTSSSLYNRWENLRHCYDPRHYALWYVELIEKMRDERYREDFGDLKAVAQ